jgi:uncharacterized protein (TIGR03437 family)
MLSNSWSLGVGQHRFQSFHTVIVRHLSSVLLATALFGIFPASLAAQTWQLVWSDEFNGAANTSPSSQKWALDTGAGGWGNQELETYSSSVNNVYQDGNGNLVIRAMLKAGGGYTSGRLTTQYSMAASYGRVEARIKLPSGKGIWPSFWMLGNDISTVGWPQCGEIDIMESLGDQPAYIHSTIHGPGYQNGIGAADFLSSGQFSNGFHIFGVVWSPNDVQFQVDSVTYATMTPASLPAGTSWVFNQPFFLLLNVAVGGTWSGYPDATTVFPQSMLVDYVRYYRDTSQPVINPGEVLDSASFTKNLAPGSVVALSGTGFSAATSANLLTTHLPTTFDGASVLVNNRAAALVSISPTLILAQIPWETPTGSPVNVQVVRNGEGSNTESITLSGAAPSVFLQGGVVAPWCLAGTPQTGTTCTMFGDGFGPLATPLQDGYPAPANGDKLQAACHLEIASINATVSYCGVAPGLFVNRLDFVYPAGVPRTPATANAVLTIGSQSVSFQLPSPTR